MEYRSQFFPILPLQEDDNWISNAPVFDYVSGTKSLTSNMNVFQFKNEDASSSPSGYTQPNYCRAG